ncbi:hypothetical protein AA0117_g969 [Alternaria alternata]|uniref:Uncharacterized protein n=1 Tax=Alternaria alternata TaxID=5599 RepID=A0A4Q4NW06_ALTAL|nr:hypothetical protein AA0117_g969 [Alternaria alternata]
MAKLNILQSSTKIYNEQTHSLSACFRGTFSNFNPDVVVLNKVGITYEYGDHYFVLVQLPHPQTSELIFQCGFLNRAYVGPYLVYEWNSLVKEQIGEWGPLFMTTTGGGLFTVVCCSSCVIFVVK